MANVVVDPSSDPSVVIEYYGGRFRLRRAIAEEAVELRVTAVDEDLRVTGYRRSKCDDSIGQFASEGFPFHSSMVALAVWVR